MNMKSLPPTDINKGFSASTIMMLMVWAFTEREDLGEPYIALIGVVSVIGLTATLLWGKR